MAWLLRKETADELVALRKDLLLNSSEAVRAYSDAKESGKVVTGPDAIMKVEGDVAEIMVDGVLTREPLACAWFFGEKNTAYNDIIASLNEAKKNPAVASVKFRINSPGGNVDGLFDTLAAIQAFKKPMSVVADMACSAAYAIAAAVGDITATGPAAMFGSIGVAVSLRLDPNTVNLASTEAPEKRPDVTTEEGRAVVVRHLDAIHELFADAIADGRGVEKSVVNETFGRGATLLAEEARSRGMVDRVVKPPRRNRSTSRAAASDEGQAINAAASGEESEHMDLKTLKAAHGDVYEAAKQEGRAEERDRVVAHLTLAEPAGADGMKIAIDAIKSGEGMTLTANARYMSVALNARDKNIRQAESDVVGAAADNASAPISAATGDIGDKTAAIMAARRGKKVAANG